MTGPGHDSLRNRSRVNPYRYGGGSVLAGLVIAVAFLGGLALCCGMAIGRPLWA